MNKRRAHVLERRSLRHFRGDSVSVQVTETDKGRVDTAVICVAHRELEDVVLVIATRGAIYPPRGPWREPVLRYAGAVVGEGQHDDVGNRMIPTTSLLDQALVQARAQHATAVDALANLEPPKE